MQMGRLLVALADGEAELVQQRLLPLMDADLLGHQPWPSGPRSSAAASARWSVRTTTWWWSEVAPMPSRTGARRPSTCAIRPGATTRLDLDTFPERIRLEVERFLRERVPASEGWSFTVRLPPDSGSYPCALGRSAADAALHPLVASARRVGERVLGYVPDVETAPGGRTPP